MIRRNAILPIHRHAGVCPSVLCLALAMLIAQAPPAYPQDDTEGDDGGFISVTVEEDGGSTIYPNTPSSDGTIKMMVAITARALLPEVRAITADCSLYSPFAQEAGSDALVGVGQAILIREGEEAADWYDRETGGTLAGFAGDGTQITAEVHFSRGSDTIPIEVWTHGECRLYFYPDIQTVKSAEMCGAEAFRQNYSSSQAGRNLVGCVWPGTEPATAAAKFKRPGLEGFDPATGGLANAAGAGE